MIQTILKEYQRSPHQTKLGISWRILYWWGEDQESIASNVEEAVRVAANGRGWECRLLQLCANNYKSDEDQWLNDDWCGDCWEHLENSNIEILSHSGGHIGIKGYWDIKGIRLARFTISLWTEGEGKKCGKHTLQAQVSKKVNQDEGKYKKGNRKFKWHKKKDSNEGAGNSKNKNCADNYNKKSNGNKGGKKKFNKKGFNTITFKIGDILLMNVEQRR